MNQDESILLSMSFLNAYMRISFTFLKFYFYAQLTKKNVLIVLTEL